jgi:acyl-CoA synthetase (AMP-forming)/AMP-acid ligase II
VNLVDLLHRAAAAGPQRPAVTDVRAGRALTYQDLADETAGVAGFLRGRGVEPGQRVGLLAPNGLGYLPAAFGILASGACLVPIATNLTPTEAGQIVARIALNGCLSWPGDLGLAIPGDRAVFQGGVDEAFAFQWLDRTAEAPAGYAGLDPAFIRFTSGTTAESKGVVLSHEATSARVEAADRVLGFTDNDRVLWVLPLAYHFAVTIVAYVRAGCHVLLCPDSLPRGLMDGVRRHRATVLYASPTHFERMAALRSDGALKSVRLVLSTAAPIRAAVMERFEAVHGVAIGQAYGIIEAGLPCINARTDDLPGTSVGRPVPGYEVAVFADDGRRLPAGVAGEVGLRGSGLFSAYYSPWRLRAETERDGWFLTGDEGVLDGTGALSLRGRKKTAIFVAGMKFFPEEVEECINQFPGVAESRVFGRPHARLGEVPAAEVVMAAPRVDLEALRAHLSRLLSPYKVPLEVTVVDAIPKTPGGKILRRKHENDPAPSTGLRSPSAEGH